MISSALVFVTSRTTRMEMLRRKNALSSVPLRGMSVQYNRLQATSAFGQNQPVENGKNSCSAVRLPANRLSRNLTVNENSARNTFATCSLR